MKGIGYLVVLTGLGLGLVEDCLGHTGLGFKKYLGGQPI